MSISITSDSKQQESKASGGKYQWRYCHKSVKRPAPKYFTLKKIPEFCEMLEEDIFYRQKNHRVRHQKGN